MTIRSFITIVTIHIFDIILLILSLLLLLWSVISFWVVLTANLEVLNQSCGNRWIILASLH